MLIYSLITTSFLPWAPGPSTSLMVLVGGEWMEGGSLLVYICSNTVLQHLTVNNEKRWSFTRESMAKTINALKTMLSNLAGPNNTNTFEFLSNFEPNNLMISPLTPRPAYTCNKAYGSRWPGVDGGWEPTCLYLL